MTRKVKYDLHMHTRYSPDSLTSLDAIIRQVRRKGLDGVAITDHNTMKGAIELAKIAPFPVILAEEIRTTEGEVIGYFLQEEIPRGLGLEETIERIRQQGGIVAVPHPIDRARASSAIGEKPLLRVMDQVDLIEGMNARCIFAMDNRKAQDIARAYHKPLTAGSDAHGPIEIGSCYVELDAFEGAADFVQKLGSAQLRGEESGGWVKIFSTYAKFAKKAGLARWK